MFSIANLLDSAKSKASIESDYRLSKLIEKTHSVISGYRHGKSLPDEGVIERLCNLSGDDPQVVAAQVQAARAQTETARALWEGIAQRLQSAPRAAARGLVNISMMLVLFATSLIASNDGVALTSALSTAKQGIYSLYIMLN